MIEMDEEERIDTLKQNGCKILQRNNGFCYGIDAVLLADYAKSGIQDNCEVFDLCTGTGIVPLLLSSNSRVSKITAIEIQKKFASMANRSVELNNLQEKIKIFEGDLKKVSEIFKKHSFDVVTCNPPYMICNHGKENSNDYKSIARHEICCNLEDVIKAADFLLKPKGSFFMIHRPFRLSEIFCILNKYGLEPKKMQLVYPHSDEAPNMVLIQAVKGAKPRITVEKPLVVRHHNGDYTEDINKIYSKSED